MFDAFPGPTFGGALAGVAVCDKAHPPTVLLNHTLLAHESHAVLHHFWATGTNHKIGRTVVEYYVDGEAAPSVVFSPSMACGHGFPGRAAHDLEYAAGGLCGKTAPVGGWWHTFPVPIYSSVLILARAAPADGAGCYTGFFNVRGTPGLPLLLPGSGLPLPFGSRLRTSSSPLSLRQPLEFVTLASLPAGTRGLIFQASLAVEARPVGGVREGAGYIEGCWNFFRAADEPFPGLVVGTGVEDYFDSGYYFGADAGDPLGTPFSNPLAGLTHFERDVPSGVERLSAYRFHASDPLVWSDGGRLVWRVGAAHMGPQKCILEHADDAAVAHREAHRALHAGGQEEMARAAGDAAAARPGDGHPLHRVLSAVNVSTHAWSYVFPAGGRATG